MIKRAQVSPVEPLQQNVDVAGEVEGAEAPEVVATQGLEEPGILRETLVQPPSVLGHGFLAGELSHLLGAVVSGEHPERRLSLEGRGLPGQRIGWLGFGLTTMRSKSKNSP